MQLFSTTPGTVRSFVSVNPTGKKVENRITVRTKKFVDRHRKYLFNINNYYTCLLTFSSYHNLDRYFVTIQEHLTESALTSSPI